MAIDPKRQAALSLLRTGVASPSEVAELAGVSRQLVNKWIALAGGIDWRAARAAVLQKAWRRAVK